MKKLTVTVTIPAYNEEGNIEKLLNSILSQNESTYILKKILVADDGSSDKTLEKIKNIKDKRLTIFSDGMRKGKTARINQFFSKVDSDLVFLMDSDISMKNKSLFSEIIENCDFEKSGLVAINSTPYPARNMFEKLLNYSVAIQKDIKKSWNNGQNYLAHRGTFMVLYGNLARSIHMPETLINNDGYIYFATREKKYIPSYLSKLNVFYRSPATFSDHLKQSKRFQFSYDELSKYFSKKIQREYMIPKKIILRTSIKYFFKNPVYFTGYILIYIATKINNRSEKNVAWTVALSTKI